MIAKDLKADEVRTPGIEVSLNEATRIAGMSKARAEAGLGGDTRNEMWNPGNEGRYGESHKTAAINPGARITKTDMEMNAVFAAMTIVEASRGAMKAVMATDPISMKDTVVVSAAGKAAILKAARAVCRATGSSTTLNPRRIGTATGSAA